MSDTCVMVLARADEVPDEGYDLIGVDAGAAFLAKQGRYMVLALGDYDSAGKEMVSLIRAYADETVVLPVIKDDSDSEAAIRLAFERGYRHVIVYGGLGGRIDHELVNLRLAYRFPGTVFLDRQNRIECLTEGRHVIKKETYDYVSFFAWQDAEISLAGMKYPLDHTILHFEDLYGLSNEITDTEGICTVHHGRVLMICSKDRT